MHRAGISCASITIQKLCISSYRVSQKRNESLVTDTVCLRKICMSNTIFRNIKMYSICAEYVANITTMFLATKYIFFIEIDCLNQDIVNCNAVGKKSQLIHLMCCYLQQ